eukprot:GCRY01001446.1.p1 GENE.GCRY01001446.1~~GCRY01001446.1.p1  ORF type:complete len:416 (+),score=89.56 GCRY01001446.1:71-1249(+)
MGNEKESKAHKALVIFYITVFLITGTGSVVFTKLLFQTEAEGIDGVKKHFNKPMFMDCAMFIGMTLCIPWDIYEKSRKKKNTSKVINMEEEEETPLRKLFWLIAVPAMCDAVATQCMYVSLLFLSSSVWQMTRGSIVIFTALIRVVWLRLRPRSYESLGVFVVVIALGIVGLAGVLSGEGVPDNVTVAEKFVALGLVLIAQLIQALQTVIEERLLHDVKASSAIIVGLEGFWGVLILAGVLMPVAYYLPGKEGGGIHEDTLDTFRMIKNSPTIMVFVICYVSVILFFNLFGMYITEVTQSLTRNILESVRTLLLWAVMLFLHYEAASYYGEGWGKWSYLELGGFFVLFFGLMIYNSALKLPWFDYPSEEEEPLLAHTNSVATAEDGKTVDIL